MERMLTVQVRMGVSGEEVCTLELPASASLAQLRELIAEKDGREVAQQTLVSGTTELRGDHKPLRQVLPPLSEAADIGDFPAADCSEKGARTVQVQLLIRPLQDVVNDVRQMRRRLEVQGAHHQEAIENGLVEKYSIYLTPCSDTDLLTEATWVFANLSSGTSEHVRVMVENGLVARLVELLRSEDKGVADTAMHALANIAGDCVEFRDVVLRAGTLCFLMEEYVEPKVQRGLTETAKWALHNMCRGSPPPSLDMLEPLLRNGNLHRLLTYPDDPSELCWVCSAISDFAPAVLIHELKLAKNLLQLCLHNNAKVQKPALSAVTKLVAAGESNIEAIIDGGFMLVVPSLVESSSFTIRKLAFQALSEIVAKGSTRHLEAFLDIDSKKVHRWMEARGFQDVRLSTCKVVAKLMSSSRATSEQAIAMIRRGYFKDLIHVLNLKDAKREDNDDVLSSVLSAVLSLVQRTQGLKEGKSGEVAGSTAACNSELATALFSSGIGERLQAMEHEPSLCQVSWRDLLEEAQAAYTDARANFSQGNLNGSC